MLPGMIHIVAPLKWRPAFTETLTTDSASAYANRLVRVVVPASRLLTPTSWQLRVGFSPRRAGANNALSSVYIAHRAVSGAASDMDPATIRQLTFGGGTTANLIAGGDRVWSDSAPFVLDRTRDLIVSIGYSAATQNARTSSTATGCTTYFKDSSASSAGTAAVTGWTATAAMSIVSLDQMEVV